MTRAADQSPSHQSMVLLSRLLLPPRNGGASVSPSHQELSHQFAQMTREKFDDLVSLASSNHVIVRALEVFLHLMRAEQNATRAEWAVDALAAERARIATTVTFLGEICDAFDERDYPVAVIKSLDHWPDLGSDLDLYTSAHPEEVIRVMRDRFHATLAPRSWGDRLACKWNFILPGLPEAVEIHMGRLGQTGEQVAIASSLLERIRLIMLCGHPFRVTSACDRLAISTLQRMYRHFYFRLCDIVDSAWLADSGGIDYENLRLLTRNAGIWEGAATYLAIVSDYVKGYRGAGLDLPQFVLDAARFRGDRIYYARDFLRVPILPQSAGLYTSQLAGVLGKGEFSSGARLSLLPWLATAAAVGQKLTGSDKGIW
ncbi:MAG TPA: hypothetical protein VMD55_01720 [Terracidiphilus sp.]|nr:hypothetical protein [Terracidiphilus sp.]